MFWLYGHLYFIFHVAIDEIFQIFHIKSWANVSFEFVRLKNWFFETRVKRSIWMII